MMVMIKIHDDVNADDDYDDDKDDYDDDDLPVPHDAVVHSDGEDVHEQKNNIMITSVATATF